MTIYDYECLTCNNVQEVNQSMKDDKLTEFECKVCKSIQPCKRLIGNNGGFKLGGSGWSKDGYSNPMDQVYDLM